VARGGVTGLSSAASGIESDSTIEVTKARGGSAGLKFSLWGVGIDLTGSGSRAQRRQFINRQTIHSQMANLFVRTESSVAEVKDDGQASWLKEGYLVRFDGFITPLPDSAPTLSSQDPKPSQPDGGSFWLWIRTILGWYTPEMKECDRRQSMIGFQRFTGLAHIVDPSGNLGPRIIALELAADYVMVARKDLPQATMQDIVAAAKASPAAHNGTNSASCITRFTGVLPQRSASR